MQGFNPTIFQETIYQLLIEGMDLVALVEGIYSVVPEHTDFPYLFLSLEAIKPYDTSTTKGCEIEFSLSCYSQAPSSSEMYEILQQALDTLQDSEPFISGYVLVNLRYTDAQFNMLNDGVTSKGTIFFRSVLEKE